MAKLASALAVVSTLTIGVVAMTDVYAQTGQAPAGSNSNRGMMRDGMMGQGGMNGIMGMMRQMNEMMDHCNSMMQDGGRPNQQWRKQAPESSGNRG